MEMLQSGWHSLAGRRPINQDACVVRTLADGRTLVAVADGMGGHQAGEVASRSALESLAAGLEQGRSLPEAVMHAGRELFEAARQNAHWSGMGTTLVALLRAGEEYVVANVGDSRAYRIDTNGVRQLTRDHTLLQDALGVADGVAESARESRWRHALTRALGTEPEVETDLFGPFSARERHTVLLCSDGLHRWVEQATLAAVADHGSPEAAARALVAAAYANGSTDNISAAVVDFIGAVARTPTQPHTTAMHVPRSRAGAERRSRGGARSRRLLIELGVVLAMLTIVLLLLVRIT